MTKIYKLLTIALGCLTICHSHPMQAQESSGSVTWDWTSVIDIAEGGTSCEDGQLIPTSDGNCVGIYTTGGGGNIYEGRIVKLDMEGQTLWQRQIQAITSTTAQRVAEGPDGTLYVAGTTMDGANLKPYVVSFDKDGNENNAIVLEDAEDKILIGALTVLSDGLAIQYTTRNNTTYKGSYYYKYFDFALEEKASSHYTSSSTISVPVNVVANDKALVVVLASGYYVDGQILVFPTGSSDSPKTFSGDYQAGYADAEDFYFVKSTSNAYAVERCAFENGYFNTKWSTTLEFEYNYYSPMVKACEDGNVYFWHKTNSVHRIAKLSAENGSIEWTKQLVIDDTDICEGYAYTLGVAENGDFVAGGHTGDFKVFWYRLASSDGAYVSSISEVVNDEFAYAYTYDEMSSFSEDTFFFCGFLRELDYTAGHTPFFVAYDIDYPDQHLWVTMPECGYVPSDYPGEGLIATDGSVYVALTVSNSPALAKYSEEGEFLWYSKCGEGITGKGLFLNLNEDGSITLVGTSEGDSYSTTYTLVANFTPEGSLISSVTLSNDVMMPSMLNAHWMEDGRIVVTTNAYDSMWNRSILIEIISKDGNVESITIPTTINLNPYSAMIDQNENIVVFGYSFDAEYVYHPAVMKIDLEGNVVYETELLANGQLWDAWSDSEGRTYVVGSCNGNYAYYGLLDANGNTIEEVETKDLGYYEQVKGEKDQPVIVGPLALEGTYKIIGRIAALVPGTTTMQWINDIESAENPTYVLAVNVMENAYAVAGYEDMGSQVAEFLVLVDKEGNLLSKEIASAIPNNNDDYYIASLATNANQALALSCRSIANLIYVGYATKYNITTGTQLIQAVDANAQVISTEYYDMQGRAVNAPAHGLFIQKRVMSDGSVRTQKVIK